MLLRREWRSLLSLATASKEVNGIGCEVALTRGEKGARENGDFHISTFRPFLALLRARSRFSSFQRLEPRAFVVIRQHNVSVDETSIGGRYNVHRRDKLNNIIFYIRTGSSIQSLRFYCKIHTVIIFSNF